MIAGRPLLYLAHLPSLLFCRSLHFESTGLPHSHPFLASGCPSKLSQAAILARSGQHRGHWSPPAVPVLRALTTELTTGDFRAGHRQREYDGAVAREPAQPPRDRGTLVGTGCCWLGKPER